MNTERTIRNRFKWAKISHRARAVWVVAYGWNGELNSVRKHTFRNNSAAMIAARNWIED